MSSTISDNSAETAQCEAELAALKSKANTLQNRRKELWREETAVDRCG